MQAGAVGIVAAVIVLLPIVLNKHLSELFLEGDTDEEMVSSSMGMLYSIVGCGIYLLPITIIGCGLIALAINWLSG